MADVELVKKMLRAVLQSSKGGVSLTRVNAEYRGLTGEHIPYKHLGYPTLEALLHSMPTVVHMQRSHTGEVMCSAMVSNETAHIAQLVARQKTAKTKSGRLQMVNCQMRVKPYSPLVLNAKPRTSLRQPQYRGGGRPGGRGGGRPGSYGLSSYGVGDIRQSHASRDSTPPANQNRHPSSQNTQATAANQNRAHSSQNAAAAANHNKPLQNTAANQNKPVQNTAVRKSNSTASDSRPDKRMTLPTRFQKEVHAHLSRNNNTTGHLSDNSMQAKARTAPCQSGSYNPQQVQGRIKEVLAKYSNGLWVSKLPQLYKELYQQELPSDALKDLENWKHICTVERPGGSSAQLLLYPAKDPPAAPAATERSSPVPQNQRPTLTPTPTTPTTSPPPGPPPAPVRTSIPFHPPSSSSSSSSSSSTSSTSSSSTSSSSTLPPEVRRNLGDLLQKYSSGLWAHALPKLYLDTYKTQLPPQVLKDLSLLADFCTVDYPMPDNPTRAILYVKEKNDTQQETRSGSQGNRVGAGDPGKVSGVVSMATGVLNSSQVKMVPPLQIPKEEYPSVLVVEATSTNSVVLRYVGVDYSQAQEKMEDEMREFYRAAQGVQRGMVAPSIGQLAAVRAEEDEEILRAQISEVMPDKVKVFYVDHGFSEVISRSKLLELHEKFLTLPFQATHCRLAGLEQFSEESSVLKKLEAMASGKILLAEILERQAPPLMVLYDTSQDDDVNINAACSKALQDKSLDSTLKVNSAYTSVCVTSVCSDGTIYCQPPSRGLTKLTEVLSKTEAYLLAQVTSEFLVSRPFCGKGCLARYKGKWSRVEIMNLHGSRVLDILFVDLGVQASVEVIELREFPPPYLRDLTTIPPQVVKCCLAELPVSVGSWTPEAVQWLRDAVLNTSDCSIKIAQLDDSKRLVHVHLFTNKHFNDDSRSVNRQLSDSDLFKHPKDVFLSTRAPLKPLSSSSSSSSSSSAALRTPPATATMTTTANRCASPTIVSTATANGTTATAAAALPQLRRTHSLPSNRASPAPGSPSESSPSPSLGPVQLPPLLELPPAGQNLDVYVSVACHPGYFVLQPWQDMYKLVVLMGEMILYYNKADHAPVAAHKEHVYAAKVDNNWHRVLVKSVMTNGLVSVYELDYGKHEVVSCTQLRPLIPEFCQLPFQGVRAQLAGVKASHWSEEATMVFRNHVEKKPLVAQLECVSDGESSPWERKVTVYLVDTSQEERDLWVHDIMAEFTDQLTKAA